MTKVKYEYFEWLIQQIHIPNGKSYNDLFERMHNLEFIWMVPNDDNRIRDGLDLRDEFFGGQNQIPSGGGVTFLEVLIALSRRIAFTAGGDQERWAWKLLKNLHLHKMSDPLRPAQEALVDSILEVVIWRTYDEDGRGGFFPLNDPRENQRTVEIWAQMNKYVMELNPL